MPKSTKKTRVCKHGVPIKNSPGCVDCNSELNNLFNGVKGPHYSDEIVPLETRWKQQQEEGTWGAFKGL